MAITRLGGANAISGTIPQGNIANASLGAVTALPAAIPTGKVLQVVQDTKLDRSEISVSSAGTFVDISGLSVNITPSSTASKILIQVSGCLDNNANGRQGFIAFYRGSTNLSGGGMNAHGSLYTNNTRALSNLSAQHLDSPSTTSAITYSVRFKCPDGGEVEWNTQGVISNITLMEVAG